MIEDFGIGDIGPNILTHLTRGLYPDARDVLREYLQNAVDSQANKAVVAVLDDAVIIEDDGVGMSAEELRASVRVALSDKDPAKNVGYKGIGIYSALNVADRLVLRTSHLSGCRELSIKLNSIRAQIENLGQGGSGDITQILSDNISIRPLEHFQFENLSESDSGCGTHVRLEAISDLAKRYYSDSEGLTKYFDQTIPLAFHPEFSHGAAITKQIEQNCAKTNQAYRTIALTLTVAGQSNPLYRPYRDPNSGVFDPDFHTVSIDEGGKPTEVGVVWACMHKGTAVIPSSGYGRGLLLKKHGFTIGSETTAMSYFRSGQKFFNRYMGEIVLLSPALVPNAARDGLEYGEVADKFSSKVKDVASKLESFANQFQETSLARSALEVLKQRTESLVSTPSEQGIHQLEQSIAEVQRRLRSKKNLIDSDVIRALEKAVKAAEDAIGTVKANNGQNSGDSGTMANATNGNGDAHSSNTGGEDSTTEPVNSEGDQSPGSTQRENRGLPYSQKIEQVIDEMNRFKLSGKRSAVAVARKIKSLYESLSKLSFNTNGTLAYAGTWVLWEILGKALAGSNEADAYGTLTNKLKQVYKNQNPQSYRDMATALEHIQKKGNANKHSLNTYAESGEPLRNEMETLHDFMLFVLQEILKNIRSGAIT